jgi:hypothetical protein
MHREGSLEVTRPACINCGKKLGKYIFQMSIPFDVNLVEFIVKKWGKSIVLMDKLDTIRERQRTVATMYEDRMESAREARLTLAVGSNELPNPQLAPSILERTKLRWLEAEAEDPKKKMYAVRIRVWRGEYGYDRQGVFHSGECARAWGTAVALDLRKKGKL